MKPVGILSRIEEAPKNMIKVKIDPKRLYELIEKQNHNLDHCEKDYNIYYKDKVLNMIKSADKIPITALCIFPRNCDVEQTLNYIDRFGAKNLNNK